MQVLSEPSCPYVDNGQSVGWSGCQGTCISEAPLGALVTNQALPGPIFLFVLDILSNLIDLTVK